MQVIDWIQYTVDQNSRRSIFLSIKTHEDITQMLTPGCPLLKINQICNYALMVIFGYGYDFWKTDLIHAKNGTVPTHSCASTEAHNCTSDNLVLSLHIQSLWPCALFTIKQE